MFPNAFISFQNGPTNNRLKVYSNNEIFLGSGAEFQIEFENYTNNVWLAKIKLNGSFISDSGLILKPGQHIYLDRYLDTQKRFKFDTYMVDDNDQANKAIQNNGSVEILFYRELINQPIITWTYTSSNINYPQYPYPDIDKYYLYKGSSTGDALYCNSLAKGGQTFDANMLNETRSAKKETGRVEEGSISNQSFKYENREFESYYSKQVFYKLLPLSQMKEEINLRQYCSNCGYRLRDNKWQFCPKCGSRQ